MLKRLQAVLLALPLLCSPETAAQPPKPIPVIEVYGYWEDTPQVVVCSTFPGGMQDVRRALRDLRRHGADINPVPIYGPCPFPPEDGHIYLVGPLVGVGGHILGATLPFQNGFVIRAAVVSFDNGHAYGLTLRHETLHAAGLGHTDEMSHVLAPTKLTGGHSWVGIPEAFRRQRELKRKD